MTKRNSTAALRSYLRNRLGPRYYRITKGDEIHVYGRRPNTNQEGWYFWGYTSEHMDF